MIAIWIEPHERAEAIEAYSNRLTPAMVEQIKEASETARIQLFFNICGNPMMSSVQVVEEG